MAEIKNLDFRVCNTCEKFGVVENLYLKHKELNPNDRDNAVAKEMEQLNDKCVDSNACLPLLRIYKQRRQRV